MISSSSTKKLKTVSQYVQTYKIISLNENRRIDLEFLHHQNKMELNHENIASRITMALTNVKIELNLKMKLIIIGNC